MAGSTAPGPGSTKVIVSWATYDLANTIYYAIVVTAFLPHYFEKHHWGLSALSVTTSVTLLLSALVSPGMGAHVDRTGRARFGLDVFTWLTTLSAAALCFVAPLGKWPTLLCYGFSLFSYQAAITFYNALLPVVAPPGRRGFVSALGTGLGYGGVPLALFIGLQAEATPLGVPGAFLVAGVLMTLFTIPLWLYVKDAPPGADVRASAGPQVSLLAALRRAAREKSLLLLLLANFVCADVANTLIQYATVYFEVYVGLSHDQSVYMLMGLAVTAFFGGIAIGRFADRMSPTKIYLACSGALCVSLLLGALFRDAAWASWLLVVTGGVGVSGIWSVGRQLVLQVSPPERYGESLGLYGVTVKASIVGTAVFGIVRDRWGYRPAVLIEAAMLAVGCLLIYALHRDLTRRAVA